MFRSTLFAAAALLSLSGPAFAQAAQSADPGEVRTPLTQDRGYDKPSARTDAINAAAPVKADDLNGQVAAQTGGAVAATQVRNAEQEAQYQQDIASYRAALSQHASDVAANEEHTARQQNAYADAMAVWRQQVYDCKHRNVEICNAPTPDPADFY